VSAHRIGRALTFAVLATSAIYMLVYLYRWEWNRALVAGLFFVAAELAFVATSLFGRLQAIEAKLDGRTMPTYSTQVAQRVQQSAPAPRQRFAWLEESARSTNVFVPVLLGAGVILSLIASAVERVAAKTGRPVLERGLVSRLEPLAPLPGGLLSSAPPGQERRGGARPSQRRWLNRLFVIAVVALGVFATMQAVDLIGDATQTRSDPSTPGVALEITLSVQTKGRVPSEDETAEALWVACRGVLNRSVTASEPVRLGGGVQRFLVTPAVGEHARRRLEGCLEDATLDRISGRVISMLEVTAPPPTTEP